jgi:hypothetical protein
MLRGFCIAYPPMYGRTIIGYYFSKGCAPAAIANNAYLSKYLVVQRRW